MTEERVLEAIKTAIQMEQDGYSFYQKAAAQTSSETGRSVFESLAADELVHLDVFQKLFQETVSESEWKTLVSSSKKYAQLSVFPKDLKTSKGTSPDTDDMDAIRIAMDSETEAIDYYSEILTKTSAPDEKKVINEIIEQEKNHYFLLQQEFDYLNSTGEWYDLNYLGG